MLAAWTIGWGGDIKPCVSFTEIWKATKSEQLGVQTGVLNQSCFLSEEQLQSLLKSTVKSDRPVGWFVFQTEKKKVCKDESWRRLLHPVSWSHHKPRLLFRSRGYKFGALFMPLHFYFQALSYPLWQQEFDAEANGQSVKIIFYKSKVLKNIMHYGWKRVSVLHLKITFRFLKQGYNLTLRFGKVEHISILVAGHFVAV